MSEYADQQQDDQENKQSRKQPIKTAAWSTLAIVLFALGVWRVFHESLRSQNRTEIGVTLRFIKSSPRSDDLGLLVVGSVKIDWDDNCNEYS